MKALTTKEKNIVAELAMVGLKIVRAIQDCTIQEAVDSMRRVGFNGHHVTKPMEEVLQHTIFIALIEGAKDRRRRQLMN